MFADYHIHTAYSDDSTEPMENQVKKAISLGMDEICFTDHVDYGVKYDVDDIPSINEIRQTKRIITNVEYPSYFGHIEKLQAQYQGQIVIKKGLEFGVQSHTIPQFEKLCNSYKLDFAILSCHQVDNQEFWNYHFQKGRKQSEYIQRYYQEILHCAKHFKGYSVLGHLDMIQRYTEPRYPFEYSRDIITSILKQVITDGKGIEVNTSSFHYNLPDLMPERNILSLYLELGGTIITVGSDAHQSKHLGAHITDIYAELKTIGFTHFCTFQQMKPIYHAL